MFGVMLTSGIWLLTLSATEEHSTIYAIENIVTLAMEEIHFSDTLASAGAAPNYDVLGIIMLVPLILAMPVYFMYRHKIWRLPSSPSQGGHSAVQVSLLVSGVLSIVISVAYLMLYLLLVK